MEERNRDTKQVSQKRLARQRRRRKKKIIITVVAALAVIILGLAAWLIYDNSKVYKTCRIEAGVEYSAADFLKGEDPDATITDRSDKVDISVPGTYKLYIKSGPFSHKVSLIIEDTIAPEFEVGDTVAGYKQPIEAKTFVTEVRDATEVTFSYETEPDFELLEKEQTITIIGTDAGGNKSSQTTTLTVWPVAFVVEKEAGSEAPELKELILDESIDISKAKIVTDMKTVDMNHVGEYPVEIKINGKTYKITIKVVDTIVPEVEFQDASGYTIAGVKPEKFVKKSTDKTDVSYKFEGDPDVTKEGSQEVTVVATDEGGNSVKGTVSMTLEKDTEAPKINSDKTYVSYVAKPISFKQLIEITDNCEDGLKIEIDSDKVNVNAVGSYKVHVKATDASGNASEADVTIQVERKTYTQAEVNQWAKEAVATCIGANQSATVRAVYSWVRKNLHWYDFSDKGNEMEAAGSGFFYERGDCYTYACVTKYLLIAAGIQCEIIDKISNGPDDLHYWNVVNIGGEWLHVDTVPEALNVLLMSDEKMIEYNDNYNTHPVDREKYTYWN